MLFSGFQPIETIKSLSRFNILSAAFSFRMPRLRFFLFSLSICMGVAFLTATGQSTKPAVESKEIDLVVHELCGKQVALLGEPPVHGFGKTLEFKVQLVRRLVDDCHYDALFMESGTYDYIEIENALKAGGNVTDGMISAAIGGLWANDEVQLLVPFLRAKVNSRSLTLGGLDDQIGAGTYASRGMASDLVKYLHGGERSRCLGILQRRLSWQYTPEAPYS